MSNSINVSQATLEQAIALAGLPPGTNIQPSAQNTSFPKPAQLPSMQAPMDNNSTLQLVSQLLQVVTTVLTLIKNLLSPGSQKPTLAQPLPQTGFGAGLPSGDVLGNAGLPSIGFGNSPSFTAPSSMTPPRSEFEDSIREFAGILSAIEETAPKIPDAVESISDAGAETWDLFFGPDDEDTAIIQ